MVESPVATHRRGYLAGELVVLFVVAPFAIWYVMRAWSMPLPHLLAPLLVLVVALLAFDRTFSWRRTFSTGFSVRTLLRILALFVVTAAAVGFLVAILDPNGFLSLPRFLPRLWLVIMIGYPLISVTIQELVYRVFFFHRYGPLFAGHPTAFVVANALALGRGHVMLENAIAVAATTAGGALFAWRYQTTRSFWAVALEHALYGNFVFTIGLGRYFFTGNSW